MSKTTPKAPILPAALLALEWLLLLIVALMLDMPWLLPFAALAALFALLSVSRCWLALAVTSASAAAVFFFNANALWLPATDMRVAVGFLVMGAALSFTAILAETGRESVPVLPRCLMRFMVILHFINAGVLLAAQYLEMSLHVWLMLFHAALVVICTADTFARLMVRLYTPRRHWEQVTAPGAFFFFAWFGPEWRVHRPQQLEAADEFHSLNLAEMWMWPAVRGGLPWLAVTVACVVWLTSGLHEVPVGCQGVRASLGAWEREPLQPGLHTSLPWPFGGVQIVDTSRVREMVLGFRADPGQPILWERAHYEGEQQSLVGGGDDYLSISVPVHFRVSEPLRFLIQIAQPEELLKQEAQRVLLTLALPRSAAQIMTTAREEMREEMRQRLQAALDAHETGLTITDVLLRDIHPPVSVAQTFQEVISALEEKEAYVHEAESYRRDSVSNARGTVASVTLSAESAARNRAAEVTGQTERFSSQLTAWMASPQLYQWREGFRIFDEALGGTKKAIFDEASSGRLPAHIDLRKVLNPDFIDSAPPVPQTLVPRPSRSLEAFDMEIEGYIKMDQGAIPAVDLLPPDADNLLKQAPAPPSTPAKQP
jgi:regulator of protease activity HflC (stomatin/prohibitin superfamily)